MNNENKEICCPEFHPEKWDKKTLNWDNRKFIKESIPTFFHTPFFPLIGQKITKMWKMAEESKSMLEDKEECLILFNDPSSFKSDIYLSVANDVPGANNVKISGTFFSMVFDGDYNKIPVFIKQMDEYLATTDNKAKDYYIHYAYCPKCAQKYGHNYIIIFAEI